MCKKIGFVIYYNKDNIYSLNAIIAAIETGEFSENINFYYILKKSDFIQNLYHIIKNHDLILVGISFFTTQLFDTYDLIRSLKSKFGDKCLFIAGGPHPTGDPAGTLEMGFDLVIVGEGEKTIKELVRSLYLNKSYDNIKGLAYFNEANNYIYTGRRVPINLDKYPPFPIKNTRFGAIEITRGCPYLCYFCQTPYISGTTPRHRNIEFICKYVKILHDYYGDLTDIRFITPNAFSYGSKDGKKVNLTKLESLLLNIREIIGEKAKIFIGTFPSEVRPEHVTQDALDLILKYADNDNITIGAQSGSQKILELCHRDHTSEDVFRAVNLALKLKLKINVDFIFGLPGEREEDVDLTIKMMRNLSKLGARIHAHSFIPLPQTPFAKQPVKPLNKAYKKAIKHLISKGSLFGDWNKQEKLAIKIAHYLKNNT
ncbi:MAG: TIGR04013 family B12-binding domain/radical SAM domain-containing protein [Promethearchaeota archaeon]